MIVPLDTKETRVNFQEVLFCKFDKNSKSKSPNVFYTQDYNSPFRKFSDNCERGQISCGNGLGENQNCCNDRNCDLDRIKSLPWDESLGIAHACYDNCNHEKCNGTSKLILTLFYIFNFFRCLICYLCYSNFSVS